MVAPRYAASVENVQKLKDAGVQPAKVGAESTPSKANPKAISIRGSSAQFALRGLVRNTLPKRNRI